LIRLYSISLFLFVSLQASATKLVVEDSLMVKEIDNQVVSQGFLSQKTVFELTSGDHAVVLKYKDVYEDLDFGDEELVESPLFVVKFTTNNQGKITIKTPKIRNLKVAKHYAKMPEVLVSDSKQKQLSVEHQTYTEYKTEQEVSTVLAQIAKAAPVVTRGTSIQPMEKTVIQALVLSKVGKASKVEKVKKVKTQSAKPMNNLSMLEYWWQQASDEEKAIFKQQIKTIEK